MLTVQNVQEETARFIEAVESYPGPYSGRGIVTCAGGARYNTCAWVLINMLRRLGCTLPIEVWYLDQTEYDEDWIRLVKPLGVTCVSARITCATKRACTIGGMLRSHAILNSGFREVLYLDADNVPVVDPTSLFDTFEYRAHGAVFWPRLTGTRQEDPAWSVFAVQYRPEPLQDSGQLLIDKYRCWHPLRLCDWYNTHGEFFYRYAPRGRDTFRLAWHRSGHMFGQPQRPAEWIGGTRCQHDFEGRRVFQHRCRDKWSLVKNQPIDGFQFADACDDLIENLKKQWSPLAWLTQHATPIDRKAMERLRNARFAFCNARGRAWSLHLRADGGLVVNRRASDGLWWVQDGALNIARADGTVKWRFATIPRRSDG